MKSVSQSGFTLLEILIALAILALSLSATIKAVSDFTGNQMYLRDRTLAIWVARNVLVEHQVESVWPSVGERKGTMDMGEREWHWIARYSNTGESDLRRIDIEVRLQDTDDKESLAVLSGFLQSPDT